MSKKRLPIHPTIKKRLGYDPNEDDREFLKTWRRRASQVCKPCWELHYCPYGPFVEQSPLLPPLRQHATEHNDYLKKCLASGEYGGISELPDVQRQFYEQMVNASNDEWKYFADIIPHFFLEEPLNISAKIDWERSSDLGPIQEYNVPFPLDETSGEREPADLSDHDRELVKKALDRIRVALDTGKVDARAPLDEDRRRYFEEEFASFNAEEYPETIPEEVERMQCNIFGHICPVVFVGEAVTETSRQRRKGRYLPFKIRMRVVRRDNYTCQHCGKHLRDDEVEFDHIIPVAQGGSSEEHNIRLTCFECNRDKSDHVDL